MSVMNPTQIIRNTSLRDTKTGVKILKAKYQFDGRNDTGSYADTRHRLIDFFTIDSILLELGINLSDPQSAYASMALDSYFFQGTGWQSWSPGWELPPEKKYPSYRSFLIPLLKNNKDCPLSLKHKDSITGQFIIYLRWGSLYLVIASTGVKTPPVQYHINRKKRTIVCEVYAVGKKWVQDELLSELTFFVCDGYFTLKDVLKELYNSGDQRKRFDRIAFLDPKAEKQKRRYMCGGWESWYNFYNNIDESLILDNLQSLVSTNNYLRLRFFDRGNPAVYQIDDGWQQGLGQWEVNRRRFPRGLSVVAKEIAVKGCIPGLWIAPFIIDFKTGFAQEHKDWILKDSNGDPVPAGFNPVWGSSPRFEYFALDLSRDDVLTHLETLFDKLINEWGFRYIKIDFLFAGLLTGNFTNPGPAYEWYERALSVITSHTKNRKGEPVAFLGCGMPFELSWRHLPLSRIGTDTLEHWDRMDLKLLNFGARPSALINMRDTLGHAFWNNAVYANDPDVVFFRNTNTSLTDKEKELIFMVNFLFGSQIMMSDDPVSFNTSADGPLTRRMISISSILENEEFGNYLITEDIYAVFSRSSAYCGIINLSDFIFSSPKNMLPLYCMDNQNENEEVDVEPIIAHYSEHKESYQFEKRSISLFKRVM